MRRHTRELAVAVVTLLTAIHELNAALVLEYDFRTPQTNATSALNQATVAANGGSPDADLIQGATINDAATALGAGYDARVATGYLSVRPVTGSGDQALGTANKLSSTDHLMKQYMGEDTFSTGSVVMVFKPQFSGLDANRRTFFWHGNSNSSNNLLWLFNNDDINGPALQRNSGILVSLPSVAWDDNSWYFLAASWKANDETDAENAMYLRPLNPLGTALTSIEDTILVDGLASMDQSIYLGRRADSGEDSGNSDMALFQLYNNAMTLSDFNNLYNELALIPEPASMHLLLIGIAVLGRRLRKHR